MATGSASDAVLIHQSPGTRRRSAPRVKKKAEKTQNKLNKTTPFVPESRGPVSPVIKEKKEEEGKRRRPRGRRNTPTLFSSVGFFERKRYSPVERNRRASVSGGSVAAAAAARHTRLIAV